MKMVGYLLSSVLLLKSISLNPSYPLCGKTFVRNMRLGYFTQKFKIVRLSSWNLEGWFVCTFLQIF